MLSVALEGSSNYDFFLEHGCTCTYVHVSKAASTAQRHGWRLSRVGYRTRLSSSLVCSPKPRTQEQECGTKYLIYKAIHCPWSFSLSDIVPYLDKHRGPWNTQSTSRFSSRLQFAYWSKHLRTSFHLMTSKHFPMIYSVIN